MQEFFADFNLNATLHRSLDEHGFVRPTSIQSKSFSVIMAGYNVQGIAQTGTGKTLAYVLPILNIVKFAKNRHPQVLVVVPTRELVVQVVDVFKQLSEHLNVVTKGVYGGTNIKTQAMELAEGADILVGTPGRLIDLVYHGTLNTKHIKKLVLDEVDEMLNLGFRKQIETLFEMLPEKRQNIMFSATMTPDVEDIIEDEFGQTVVIEAAPSGTPLENISQTAYTITNNYTKLNLLKMLIEKGDMPKVMLFVSTKALADDVFNWLKDHCPTLAIGIIHSNKDQNFRFNTVKAFKSGDTSILIATDIIARGIDVDDVSHVINFNAPDEPEQYIHRIGRTGRYGKLGHAISLITEKEEDTYKEIESLMHHQITRVDNPENLVVSDVLMDIEQPVIFMKNQLAPIRDLKDATAFHEKKAKNTKTNKKLTKAEQMRLKYKKPKTRGQKK
ncbi:MAG: DEAD/DEAH box helicase [Saprospiraceae bacterium]